MENFKKVKSLLDKAEKLLQEKQNELLKAKDFLNQNKSSLVLGLILHTIENEVIEADNFLTSCKKEDEEQAKKELKNVNRNYHEIESRYKDVFHVEYLVTYEIPENIELLEADIKKYKEIIALIEKKNNLTGEIMSLTEELEYVKAFEARKIEKIEELEVKVHHLTSELLELLEEIDMEIVDL